MRQAIRQQRYRISSHANDEMADDFLVATESTMKGDQCEFCEGEMKQRRVLARVRFKGRTIYVENVPAWVCNRCGEQYFDAPVYKRLEEIARQGERIQRVISFPLAELDMAIA